MGDRPRRRNSATTRQALLHAATDLFTERGFDRTSVRDVAAAAGVDQALVFRYFGTKEDLLHAVLTAPGRILPGDMTRSELLATTVREVFAERPGGQAANLLLLALSGRPRGRVAETLEREVAGPYRAALADRDDPAAALRADLVLAWLLGLVLTRQARPDGPLGTADPGEAVGLVLHSARDLLAHDGERPNVDAVLPPA